MADILGPSLKGGAVLGDDGRWEFDAPRFHDFETGTPDGQQADEWFSTSATRGLASPAEPAEITKGLSDHITSQPSQRASGDDNAASIGAPKNTAKNGEQKASEAEQVRAVLAHITNTTAPRQLAAPKSVVKPTPKSAVKPASKPSPAPLIPQKERQALQPENMHPGKAAAVPSPWHATRQQRTATKPKARQPPPPRVATAPPRVVAKPTKVISSSRAAPAKARQAPKAAAGNRQQASKARAPAAPKLTVPKSPMLRSKQRQAVHRHQVKSSEDLEMEEIERAKREAAAIRRRNARSTGQPSRPPVATQHRPAAVKRRGVTEPQAPELHTSKRQRTHGMSTRSTAPTASPWKSTAQRMAEFASRSGPSAATKPSVRTRQGRPVSTTGGNRRPQLTLPRTPRFATTNRARAPRFKSTEEQEAEEAAAHRNFKARPVNRRALQGAAVVTRSRAEKKPATVPVPFSFATDARAVVRNKVEATLPPPFVFGAEGPSTRSRARMVTTVAPELPRGQAQQHVMGGGAVSSESEAEGSRELRSGRRPSGPAPFLFDKRRRTTAGPLLLGGAVRVLQPKQASDEEAGGEDDVMVEAGGEDGMQAIIRAGAGNAGPTTLHNPLFRA